MKQFLIAVQFLTRLPVRIGALDNRDIGASYAYFPAVGLLVGVLLAGVDTTLHFAGFGNFASSAITVISLVVLTGAIHLDGLADTCDALYSGRGREEMLRIMRDPRSGAMGVVGIVSVLILKVALLCMLTGPSRPFAIVAMCVLGRWAMVFALQSAPYAREEGKAKHYCEGANRSRTFAAAAITLAAVSIPVHLNGIAIFAIITGVTYLMTARTTRLLGGITGDTLGATDELMETLTLFLLCLAQGGL